MRVARPTFFLNSVHSAIHLLLGELRIPILAAFAIRIIPSLLLYDMQFSPETGNYEFGWELGRVARSLAEGRGFGSPIDGETGPTSWLPPIPVMLLSGLFSIFGVYSTTAALASLTLNCIFSTLTLIPLYHVALQIAGSVVARYVAWSWVFFPFAIFNSVTRIWGEPLDALLVSCLVWLAIRLANQDVTLQWVLFGLLAGVAILTNPNFLSMLPLLAGVAAGPHVKQPRRFLARIILAAAVLALTVTPWLLRDLTVFGQFMPIKSNFWLEVDLGNNPNASVMLVDWNRHPASNPVEFLEYDRLGEVAYMDSKKHQALSYIYSNPKDFVILSVRRAIFWWTGYWSWDPRYLASEPMRAPFIAFNVAMMMLLVTGLFSRYIPGRMAIFISGLLLCQSAVYYVTHPAPEYRHAVEPLIVLLATVGGLVIVRSSAVQLALGASRRLTTAVSHWAYDHREPFASGLLGGMIWSLDSLMHVLEDHGSGVSVWLWLCEFVSPKLITLVIRLLFLACSLGMGFMLLRLREKEHRVPSDRAN